MNLRLTWPHLDHGEGARMKGFMRQRGSAWELRVFLGYDPVTGKQRYAQRTVRGGKREARRP